MRAERWLLPVTVLASFGAAHALPAQRVVDDRSQALRTFATVGDACVTIGDGTKGRPEGLLRVTGASFGKDGLILLSNTGTSEVLVFDSTGRYLRSAAREGGGPGELSKSTMDVRSQRLLPFRGDSVIVFDNSRLRLLVFDGAGRFARSVNVDLQAMPRSRAFSVPGMSVDGDFALVWSQPLPRLPDGLHTTEWRDTISILRAAADGHIVWRSQPLEDAHHQGLNDVSRPKPGATVIRSYGSSAPATRLGSVALGSRVVYHYSERTNEVHIYARTGALTVRVLLPPMAAPTTGRQSLAMLADQAGRAWLEVPLAATGSRREWLVISETGDFLGSASTSSGQLLSVGGSRLLLLARDQDGVETVRSCSFKVSN